jgi:NCAIR mutase (PurE)-related protein
MEGALSSVVGGLVDKPVFAVPSGIGYGAGAGGIATLLAMLNCCASGVSVMNIGNGFGAAYMAATICRLVHGREQPRMENGVS